MWILLPFLGCTESPDADADGWLPPDDCDDHDAAVSPSASDDDCDGVDDDCDGLLDEAAREARLWYPDADGDGHGVYDETPVTACEAPSGYALVADDCDDAEPAAHPGASETATCDGIDEDCDGLLDEDAADATWWYADADADGRGDPDVGTPGCSALDGYVADSTDCDDTVSDTADDGCAATRQRDEAWATLLGEDEGDAWPASVAFAREGGLAVGASRREGASRVYVFPTVPTGETPLSDAPSTFEAAAEVRLGANVAWVPDATGDGVGDLAVSTWDPTADEAVVYLVAGGGTGSGALSSAFATIVGDVGDGLAATDVVAVGGEAGSGVWVSATGAAEGAGEARYYTGLTGTLGSADAAATITDPSAMGELALLGAEDLDGDGVSDLVAGAGDGNRFVFYGTAGASPIDRTTADADVWLTAPDAGFDWYARRIAVGDFDGDGAPDLALGAPGDEEGGDRGGAVFVWTGSLPSEAAVDDAPARLLSSDGLAGASLASVPRDEGVDALVVGAPYAAGERAVRYAGEVWMVEAVGPGVATLLSAASVRVRGEREYEILGVTLLGTPDLDGDGTPRSSSAPAASMDRVPATCTRSRPGPEAPVSSGRSVVSTVASNARISPHGRVERTDLPRATPHHQRKPSRSFLAAWLSLSGRQTPLRLGHACLRPANTMAGRNGRRPITPATNAVCCAAGARLG